MTIKIISVKNYLILQDIQKNTNYEIYLLNRPIEFNYILYLYNLDVFQFLRF